jgi:hypothetical protein
MEIKRKVSGAFDLVTGENTYASQTAQNPKTSRRVKSLIPSASGELLRELVHPKYLDSALPTGVQNLYQFDQNDGSGVVTRHYFATTGVKIYKSDGTSWIDQGLSLATAPMFRTLNNNLVISDGSSSYIFNGTSWFIEGFPIPLQIPIVDTSVAGSLSIQNNRYFWVSYADQTDGQIHESSVSPISVGTGTTVNKKNTVRPWAGTVTTVLGSPIVTGVGTLFDASFSPLAQYRYKLYVDGTDFGVIASFDSPTQLTLVTNAGSALAGKNFIIAPERATHWHIYASEADQSKVGLYLVSVPITTMEYADESPFLGDANTLFTTIKRPKRNDAPIPSQILEVFKERIWRRRDTRPNFYVFSAGDEVASGLNGSAFESYPGTDEETLSDIVNEESYPVESNRIRNITAHGEALFLGTERQCVPLYGDDIDDFAISQITAFQRGIAGRFAAASTSHGFAFISYDKKALLYPSVNGVPVNQDVDSLLREFGLPIRKSLEQIKSSDLDNVHLVSYKYGRRDWLVLCYQDSNSAYHTWVFDWDTGGWFELQRGYMSLAVFEVSAGNLVLVGGGTDGYVYVIDDLTGTFNTAGIYPVATWRPALIDFDAPQENHLIQYVEFELTNSALKPDITVKVYLDPVDVDNLGSNGRTITMAQVKGANRYRGFLQSGATCQRALLEFTIAASTHSGGFRSVLLKAKPVTGLMENV